MTHRRRRIEWPTEDANLDMLNTMKGNNGPQLPIHGTAESKSIIDEELTECYASTAVSEDTSVLDVLYTPEKYRDLVSGIRQPLLASTSPVFYLGLFHSTCVG